ncbi:MAG: HIT family hydrolase [Actinobacteria bacterium RBG_16_64_13]|nr:MAG: HIT family hydrolase [Actinobacteria bacterium RBG_16_64_13]
MERLWAPWRLQYVTKEKQGGCIFCEKPQLGDDLAAHIVHRGAHAYVMLNAFPYNNGHLMVAPFAHISALEELPSETIHEMMDLAQQCTRALKFDFHPDGFNVGFNLGAAAGAGIKDHLHLHLVPRWLGDTNFMPVIADVRVIPQSLDRSYDQLVEAFARLQSGE